MQTQPVAAPSEIPTCSWASPSAQTAEEEARVGSTKFEAGSFALERVAFTVPEFCFRNNISRLTYHRLRADGRGPVEMRLGLNAIRITAEAERDWQQRMQEPREDWATQRAVKAGSAAVKSSKHISKKRAARRSRQSPMA
jgi:hypothetical protein